MAKNINLSNTPLIILLIQLLFNRERLNKDKCLIQQKGVFIDIAEPAKSHRFALSINIIQEGQV